MPGKRNSTFFVELGPGGLSTLALACASALLLLGLPVVRRRREVLSAVDGDAPCAADAIVVLGRELRDDRPTEVFRARLDRGLELWRAGWAHELIVSGGLTGTATRSEAAAGRDYLLEAGAPTRAIRVEERSRHTLENLYYVRETLGAVGRRRIVMVSDPLHLARASALARGLGFDVVASPAASAPPRRGSLSWRLRAMREAFLLHWYHVGVAYSRALGSEKLLTRVR